MTALVPFHSAKQRIGHARFQPAWGLAAALAFPWCVQTVATLTSGLGLRPLAGPLRATAILVAATVFTVVVARRAAALAVATTAGGGSSVVVRALAVVIACAAMIAQGVACLASSVFPLVAYDTLGYRLPVIADWLDAGRIAWVMTDDPVRNGYPFGQEVVSAVVAAATGSLRLAGATSFPFVAAGVFSIWWIAEVEGVRRPLARASAALFALTPVILLNAASGYVDAAFAGSVIALFVSAALVGRPGFSRPIAAVMTGMAAALVLSLKANGPVIVTIVALMLCVRAVRREVRGRLLLVAATFATPGSFWVLRNVAHTGNPLWPANIRVAGHTLFHGVRTMPALLDIADNTPREYSHLGNLARVGWTWLQTAGPALDCDDRRAGLGWLWLLLGVPAIGAVLAHALRRREVMARGAVVILMTIACFVVQPMNWWPRYTAWVWGAGALAIALGAERLARAGRDRAVALASSVAVVFSVGEGTIAALHANGLGTALGRLSEVSNGDVYDVRHPRNTRSWVDPKFWTLGVDSGGPVCRGAWKPGSDDANLDGVFAQLRPRPSVRVVLDDHATWERVRRDWGAAGCVSLLLFRGSRVIESARADPAVVVKQAIAFDPLLVVRRRTGSRAR